LIPCDKSTDWDHPSGLRIGTTEVTRLGMKEAEMESIAELIVTVLEKREPLEVTRKRVVEMRSAYQKIHYCFDGQ
ncbi:serine hydroxymethyltransferase, partial [Bacillus wiedmannii]|nr:serine hydroxymethyltransferase [Bacillus wiedmannii]